MNREGKYYQLLLILLAFISCSALGQETSEVYGIVKDESGLPIPGARVRIKDQNVGIRTKDDGSYLLKISSSEICLLVFSIETYKSEERRIDSREAARIELNVTLFPTLAFEEVEVVRKSESTKKNEEGFQLDVLELKKLSNLTGDVNKVLKATPGINIRETGGLGSGFELSLNGLSGKQIRYFIDGVPMENFGSSLTLNNYPVNLIKRVEIYKGAVPISLSSDALGGAINIVTDDRPFSFLDIAYSGGSFNTHRLSLNGQYAFNKRVILRFLSFFNHSDNSYDMDSVSVYDLELGNFLEKKSIKRWHDHYTSGMARAELIIDDVKWTDRFSFRTTFAANRKNYQHPDNNLKRVFNDFHSRNKTLITSVDYAKKVNRFDIGLYAMAGWIEDRIIDTSRLKYNWNQEFLQREEDNPKGELYERRSLFVLNDFIQRSSVGVGYEFSKSHRLETRFYQGYLVRTGEDLVNEFNTSFVSQNFIEKYILGFSYRFKTKNEKLQCTVFGKEYWFRGKITSVDFEDNEVVTKPSLSQTGFGTAGSIYLFKPLLLRLSAEKAYRIPEAHEILGDGVYINPNPELKSENSLNLNAGLILRLKPTSNWLANASVNGFYRLSKDFIRFKPLGPFGTYENLENITTIGVEGGVEVTWKKRIRAGVNMTFQNITDQTEFDEGLPNVNHQSRIPNVPWLFGNARLGYYPTFGNKKQQFGISTSVRYVHEFFLTWENLGSSFSKHIIPMQFTQGLDIEYSWKEGRYNVSFSVSNLWNATVYDNFSIPRPGRAFYAKMRYNLRKKSNPNNRK